MARSFRGYRLLSEYFACPERFLFAQLNGLDRAFAGAQEACEVVLLFKRASPALNGAVSPAYLRPYCTPAINPVRDAARPHDGRAPTSTSTRVIPDRAHPLDYEVFARPGRGRPRPLRRRPAPAAPLYGFGALLYDWQEALFYVTRLTPRRLSTKEQRIRRRGDYVGSETFISLTSPGAARCWTTCRTWPSAPCAPTASCPNCCASQARGAASP